MDPYKNARLPVGERVNDLLSRMTLEEKIGQMQQIAATKWNLDEAKRLAAEGRVGSLILASSSLAGSEEQHTVDINELNLIQETIMKESRLGIPIINGRDVIHGHRTVFPIPLGLAASWNPALVKDAAEAMAREAAADGVHWSFAPMMDISRDPRWGRIAESFGEDPCLASAMALAYVRGMQGDNPAEEGRVAACAKHFVGYGASEGGRDYESTDISENTLRNIYLRPFKAAVEAGVLTVMSSFNEIGGEPVTASHRYLTGVLKEEFGFEGFVVSDWDAVIQLKRQGIAGSDADAARLACNAGVDMDMQDRLFQGHLAALVRSGSVSEARIDDAVRRILFVKFTIGLFEEPFLDVTRAATTMLTPDHLALSRRMAGESMVLLKNSNGILPLSKKKRKIAVVGPLAQEQKSMMGTWVLDGNEKDVVPLVRAIAECAPAVEVMCAGGWLADEMLVVLRSADVIILALGESSLRSGEAHSIADIILPPGQEELLRTIASFGKPVVTVIFAGRPLALPHVAMHSDALLYAWHPGTMGCRAVADILFGDLSPSGKLPATFPRCTGQIPVYYNHKNSGRWIDEYYGGNGYHNYQDVPGKPLFPFGFGLSYTEFRYRDLTINDVRMGRNDTVIASVVVENAGGRTGDEVVQWYLTDPVATTTRPCQELKGFERITLAPGESRTVFFTIGFNECAFYTADNRLTLESGEFIVRVGGSALTNLSVTFAVE